MSRLGKTPIKLPNGVETKIENNVAHVKGPKGELEVELKPGVQVNISEGIMTIELDPKSDIKSSFHGLYRSLLANAVQGVSKGFEKKLTLIGVGFRANMQGDKINMQVGFSHPTLADVPEGLSVKVDQGTTIVITGIDKQKVGQFAAELRSIRPPEPYKGKGVRYENEYVRKKAGKAAKTA